MFIENNWNKSHKYSSKLIKNKQLNNFSIL